MAKYEGGFGASASDVERGHLPASKTVPAARDVQNYRERYSIGPDNFMYPYVDPPVGSEGNDDITRQSASELRSRDRRTPGLLERPWPPNDRN